MEFEGRITKVLPTRSGTGQNGEWKILPFVFEYFENDEQRTSDKVLLETRDHEVMRLIGQFVERGQENKAIIENGVCKLNVPEIKCRCNFYHNIREWEGKIYNHIRLFKFEILTNQVPQPAPQPQQLPPTPFPPQQPPQQNDELPF